MGIESIKIDNVSVFDTLEIGFSKGINVFIGDNGTGKTHLLKILYACCEAANGNFNFTTVEQLGFGKSMEIMPDCFISYQIVNLIACIRPDVEHGLMRSMSKGYQINIRFHNHENIFPPSVSTTDWNITPANRIQSVFIPAKEMLTHSGMENDYRDRYLPFDKTLIDIIEKSNISELRAPPEDMEEVIEKIKKIIGGKVIYTEKEFFIKRGEVKRGFQVEAEGHKKFALIERLIKTGKVNRDSILFWDEPEANISPKNVPELVDILFDLQKAGVQIFLATHDYLITKYIEYRMDKESNDVLFHSLYRKDSNDMESPVLVESSVDFTEMEHNDIVLQPIALYKKLLDKGMD